MTAILMHSPNGNSTVVAVSYGGIDFNALNKEPQSFIITETTMTPAAATAGISNVLFMKTAMGKKWQILMQTKVKLKSLLQIVALRMP